MIVTLTHQQNLSVRRRVPELHGEVMLAHRTKRGRTQHDYELPAIAWRQILDALRLSCFGPLGGKLDRGVPKSAYSAIARIADGVKRMEAHPALSGRFVQGWLGDVIPAWVSDPDCGRYCPYPRDGEMALLVPRHRVVNDMEVTSWHPGEPPLKSWTFDPAAHREFL